MTTADIIINVALEVSHPKNVNSYGSRQPDQPTSQSEGTEHLDVLIHRYK